MRHASTLLSAEKQQLRVRVQTKDEGAEVMLETWRALALETENKLRFIEQRHEERCGCHGEACELGSDLAEFDLKGG